MLQKLLAPLEKLVGAVFSSSQSQTIVCVLFLTIGVFFYGHFESTEQISPAGHVVHVPWTIHQTLWFSIVTSTTVGYGDLCPTTWQGRLFTCLYAIIGVTVIVGVISKIAETLLSYERKLEKAATAKLHLEMKTVDTSAIGLDVSPAELNKLLNYRKRYIKAITPPVVVMGLGVVLGMVVEGWSFIDALYWTIVTCTTIGYGDISPETTAGQILAMIYLPCAVVSITNSLMELSNISTRKAIRSMDFESKLGAVLLSGAVTKDFQLTEGEFVVRMLQENDLVDEQVLIAIRRQFRFLDKDKSGTLDDHDVFIILQGKGQIKHIEPWERNDENFKKLKDKHCCYVDTTAQDGGFAEWHIKYWLKKEHEVEAHTSTDVIDSHHLFDVGPQSANLFDQFTDRSTRTQTDAYKEDPNTALISA